MRKTVLIATLLATICAAPAHAQTIDDARAFFDQVVSNNGTMVYAAKNGGEFFSGTWVTPNRSTTAACRTSLSGPSDGQTLAVTIDWARVVDTRHFFDKAESPGLLVVGGATYGSAAATPALLIQTNSITMDPRLTKAMAVLIRACAPASHGF